MSLLGRVSRSLDHSTPKGRAARRITWVCSAVCFLVMTISVSIQRGFEESIGDRVGLLGGDLMLSPQPWGVGESGAEPIPLSELVELAGVEQALAVQEQPVVVQAGGAIRGAVVRHAPAQATLDWLEGVWVERPAPDRWSDSSLSLAISATLARRLSVELGSTIDLLVFSDTVSMPYKIEGYVAGVYSTSIETAEEPMIFATSPGVATGYLLRGRSIDRTAAEDLGAEYGWQVSSIDEQAPELFDWLTMLRSNMILAVVVILAVGLINLLGGVLIFILEGTRTIALLGALGLSQGRIRTMFMLRSLSVVGQGALWGVGFGVALAAVQHYFGVVRLNAADYFVDRLPAAIAPWEWLGLSGLALVLIGVSVWGASYTLGRIDPASALTYE